MSMPGSDRLPAVDKLFAALHPEIMGSHHHHHHHPGGGDRPLGWAVGVNLALSVAQVAGGIVSGSLALIADAVHNLSDAMALVIALWARRIARRPSDARMTFGYGRAETVAALVNYTTLIVIALYLGVEAAWRLVEPQPVTGWIVVAVAGLALAVDLVTAGLTFRLSRDSQNVRAAFLHNLADAASSVAVIAGGTLVLLHGWWLVDPLVTLAISTVILWHVGREIGPVVRILMLGAPPEVAAQSVIEALQQVPGVVDVHNLYLWQVDERRVALQAHLVVAPERAEGRALRGEVRDLLQERFRIGQVALEIERDGEACRAPAMIGG